MLKANNSRITFEPKLYLVWSIFVEWDKENYINHTHIFIIRFEITSGFISRLHTKYPNSLSF